MLREIVIPKKQTYTVQLPYEFINQEIEIIAFPINSVTKSRKRLKLTTFKKGKKLKDFSREDAYRGII